MVDIRNFEKNDWDHLHDCIFHVTEKRSTQDELEKIFQLIPQHLQLEAIEWGMNDTVWRDNFIDWMELKIKNEKKL